MKWLLSYFRLANHQRTKTLNMSADLISSRWPAGQFLWRRLETDTDIWAPNFDSQAATASTLNQVLVIGGTEKQISSIWDASISSRPVGKKDVVQIWIDV